MSDRCDLTIVLPAYREAESLRALLPRLIVVASRLTPASEILVVDAVGAVDDTRRVCAEHGVRHVFRANGNSYGDAVRTGIAESRGKFVVFMDADGSHNPDDLERLWRERDGYDVVIGSRYIAGGRTENPAVLLALSLALNVFYRVALGLGVRDLSNSFRLYRGEGLRALALDSKDFDIIQEILIKLACGPARMGEVPVTFEKRKAGESKRSLLGYGLSYLGSIRRFRNIRRKTLKDRAAALKREATIRAHREGSTDSE